MMNTILCLIKNPYQITVFRPILLLCNNALLIYENIKPVCKKFNITGVKVS